MADELRPNSEGPRPAGWWRWIAFIVVCIVGGSFLASEPGGSYSTAGKLVSAWIGGALAVALLVQVLGLGRYLLRKRGGHASTFRDATYSPLILSAALLIALMVGVGHSAQRRDPTTRAAGLARGTQLTASQEAFITFQRAVVGCVAGPGTRFGAAKRLSLADEHAHRSSSLRADFSHGLAAARTYRGCFSRLPRQTADLRAVVKRLTHGGSLLVAAWTLYVRGLGPPVDQASLTRGDALEVQAAKQFKLGVNAGDALYQRLGGAAALGNQLAPPSRP